MAIGNSVNDEIHEQHQKMKGRTFKEKAAYFWEYYKIHTLVIILVAVFGGNLIYTIATAKDEAFSAAFVNVYMTPQLDQTTLTSEFETYAEIDTREYEALFETDMNVDYEGMDTYSAANMQKIMALTSAKSLDVILTDDHYFERNLEDVLFGDLSDFLSAETLEKYADRIVCADIPEDDKGEVPVAIDIRDSALLYPGQESAWFCIVSNCQRPRYAEKFLEFVMNYQAKP